MRPARLPRRPRGLVHEPDAALLQVRQRRVDVGHAQRDVVQAGARAVRGTSRSATWAPWPRAARAPRRWRAARSARAPTATARLRRLDVRPKRLAEEGRGLLQPLYRDPDVIQHDTHQEFFDEPKPWSTGARRPARG